MTYYVHRSDQFENYKGVWSLLSMRYDPEACSDPPSLEEALPLFQDMSDERLNGAILKVKRYLTSGTCNKNPMDERVFLHLYELEIREDELVLNPRFYTDGRWLNPEEYRARSADSPCGLCMRLWSDYCVRNGLADDPFAPLLEVESGEVEPSSETWKKNFDDYKTLIEDTGSDAHYLRWNGVQQPILELVGVAFTADATVLDAGCGSGWLFDMLSVRNAYECDVVEQPKRPGRTFVVADMCKLPYESRFFNLVVSSLSLMWVEEYPLAFKELFRVTRPGGRFVLTITHPYAYRTGEVQDNGEFRVTRDPNSHWTIPDLYINGVVGPLTYYHHPLSAYINAAVEAGWEILHMREWSIDGEEYTRVFEGTPHWKTRSALVPLYAHFAMKRPNA